MRGARLGVAAIAVLALAGCAVAPPTGPSVIAMPGKGKTFDEFRADDAVCRQYAAQQTGIAPAEAANQSLVTSAAVGTVLGAAAGAAIGAAAGNPAAGAAIGAGSGAILGTASGAGAAEYSGASVQQRYDIGYVQCMSAKGENVPQLPATTPVAYAPSAYPYPYPYPYAPYPYAAYPYYPSYYPYYRGWYGPHIWVHGHWH